MTEGWHEAAKESILTIASTPNYSIKFYADVGIIPDLLIQQWIKDYICKEPVVGAAAIDSKAFKRQVMELAANSIHTSSRILEQLAQLPRENSFKILTDVAQNPNTPVYIIEKMAAEDSDLRFWVAKNPSTPTSILGQLASGNSNVHLNTLEQWIRIEGGGVVSQIALSPNAPAHFLERLAMFRCAAIALNPNTPTYILEQCAKDSDAEIRASDLAPGQIDV